MAKLRIKLKQHTPIIQFQGEQDGAVLRATEFKPKLDKFLIRYAYNNKFDEYKRYLIGYKEEKEDRDFKDKKAFNYKVRFFIEEGERKKYPIPNNFPLYLANMGKTEDTNYFVFCDEITLEIFSYEEKIINKIVEILPEFLINHNFGQRQSKGFGSFYINNEEYELNNEIKKYDIDINNKCLKYYFVINRNDIGFSNESKYYNLFNKINYFYKKIRQIIGRKYDPYIKQYMETKYKGMMWDKEAIKKTFESKKGDKIKNGLMVKDLLGLSVEETWTKSNFRVKKEHMCTEEKEKIERMQSPIFFKPIIQSDGSYKVYFEGRDIPKEFFNKTFKISKYIGGKYKELDPRYDFEINTPDQFDINEFIEFVMKKENKIYLS